MRAILFDLDGTLVDTVYAHVIAWQQALEAEGLRIEGWRIHRKIGMSGGLFTRALARELGQVLSPLQEQVLKARHSDIFQRLFPHRTPLPGALTLLRHLERAGIPYGIATSGSRPAIDASLAVLEVPPDVVVIERSDVARAKPEPDLFLACQQRLGVAAGECYVVGDAVWDLLAAQQARMLSIGLLTGGYGRDELFHAGAYRVYRDAAELDRSLDELGLLP